MTMLWGGNMVSIKLSNEGVSPLTAAAVRSACASLLIWLYARSKGEPFLLRREDARHGLIIGALFGIEFLFLYWGLAFTDASRAVIFLYTVPVWTVVGAHFFIADDRLSALRSVGIFLAFLGIIAVFGARSSGLNPLHWVGDLMEVGAAIFWAATSIYIKRFIQGKPITHIQTLFAQLVFSIPILAAAALIIERGDPVSLEASVVGALAYQIVLVSFVSYLVWFWMVHRYPVSRLSSFLFLAPLFGVIFSKLVLGDELTPLVWIGLTLTAAGIYLVNRPERKPT